MAGPFSWFGRLFRVLTGSGSAGESSGRASATRARSIADAFETPPQGAGRPEVPESSPPTAQAERPGRERRGANRESLDGLRVLVIDDSTTVLAILKKMLTQNGCEVFEALDAESGLEQAFADPPDLILLDIVLPGMSGFVALRLLRKNPQTHDVPVIMISGNKQATEEYYVQRIGADDFMTKPFTRAELFERVQRVFAARRAGTSS